MSNLADWEAGNDKYLASALSWLRLRLASYAAAQRTEIIVPSATEPPPEEPRPQRWRWRGPSERASPTGVAGPALVPAGPIPALPPPAPRCGLDEQMAEAEAAMQAAESCTPPPALVRLGQLLGLSAFERQVLLLCAAMELDPDMGARCAEARGDLRFAYPTFALALSALPDPAWDVLSPQRGLRWWRLVEINQPGGQPLVTSALRADERIVSYVKGLNELDDRLEPLLAPLGVGGIALPASQLAAVQEITERWSRTAAATRPPVVQLLGPDTLSKRLVAAEAAARVGLRLYRLPTEALPSQAGDLETLARLWARECTLLDGALYVDAQEIDGGGAGEDAQGLVTRFLARTDGVLFLAAREPWAGFDRAVLAIDVERPSRAEQREAWTFVLGPVPEAIPDALAGQFDLNLPTIQQIARTVPVEPEAGFGARLWDACLASTRPRLDALAQRLEPKATWNDLVLPAPELALLHQIADQVAQRSTVYERWGFGARMNRGLGINALFAGPSGTGKTMAAEVIANELRLNLYRIDLSAVVSKYIGETEKNLRRLFDAAEEGAALLFFDEADALFGKRSEVKDSHDRYANIEVNYLLQRMESYRGLAVLATNMRSALDQAFLRRLRFIVTFPFPGLAERRAIWERVFPAQTPTAALDLDRLAGLPATGGMIHTIALNAAFVAAHSGGHVTMPILLDAARTEFRKLELPIRDRDFTWQEPAGVGP
ncbi:MAG: ATP-binding protein [Egibacteraceae bacterium]